MALFQGRSSSTSSFHASLLQAINAVMPWALCPQIVSRVPQHFRFSETQATVRSALPASPSVRSFPFTPACPGVYSHASFSEQGLSVGYATETDPRRDNLQ